MINRADNDGVNDRCNTSYDGDIAVIIKKNIKAIEERDPEAVIQINAPVINSKPFDWKCVNHQLEYRQQHSYLISNELSNAYYYWN